MTTNHHNGTQAGPLNRAYEHKWSYLAAFLAVFFVTYSLLATADLLPEAPAEEPAAIVPAEQEIAELPALGAPESPTRIVIDAIDLDVAVKNPQSTDIAVLDAALLHGAVRYPSSAALGEEGNTILMAHSSYLPVVNNPAFKAFNGIQDLEKGDRITVEGEGTAYVYAVTEVREADANEDAIPLTDEGYTLTLATCDSFGKKTDRFIVTATLVDSYPLAN